MTNDRTNIWQIRDAISIMNADATAGRQARGLAGRGEEREGEGRDINIMA